MTRALPRPCTYRDAAGPCSEYAVNRARCEKHQRSGWVQDQSRHARGYDAEHERDRRRQLRKEPICQWPGCREKATDLDHIIPLANGGAKHDPGNHQSLCRAHHRVKTAREGQARRALA